MEIFRRLATEAPGPRAFREDKPTLLMSWWCTIYAITAILFRIIGRYVRTEKIYVEDGIMLLAIVPLLIRMALVHVVLLFGTNNTIATSLSPESVHQREMGSQLVLASRVMYTTYLWMIKYSTSVFLHNLTNTSQKTSRQHLVRSFRLFLALTLIASIISALATCQPFAHYWQVVPDPGPQCRQGYGFLLTMGVLNIITNFALVVIPLPKVLKSKLPGTQKFSISVRLALPLLSVSLTLYQIPTVINHNGLQSLRTLLASLDILLATFIANAPVLVSLLQDRGFKKTKWKWELVPTGGNGRALRRVEVGWQMKWQQEKGKDHVADGPEVRLPGRDRRVVMEDIELLSGKSGNSQGDMNGGVDAPEDVRLGNTRAATPWEVTEVSQ